MQIGTILDVAIGLATTFLMLAVIASGVQEVIAGVFKWRGTYLRKAIDVLIDNDPAASFDFKGVGDWLRAHFTRGPAAACAAETAATSNNAALQRVTKTLLGNPLLRGVPNDLPSYVSSGTFALALLDALRDGSADPAFAQIKATVAALPDGDLKTTLGNFVNAAGGDTDKFRALVESWFDDAMDHLSGIYKRFSQVVILAIAAALTLALDIDALHLARTLWDLPVSRSALVASAGDLVAHGIAADPASQLKGTLAALQAQPLPFGWTGAVTAQTIAGWILTALAVSLGAPFWFGLVQNLTDLRAAGPKPARGDAAATAAA